MGMAAGQARFLGLTARKTNVEFEGQQINQQRTTLANQSAAYNNQLLGLKVPTAPSVESFSKTTYSWSQAGVKNTLEQITPNSDGTYNVRYKSPTTDVVPTMVAMKSVLKNTDASGAVTRTIDGYKLNPTDAKDAQNITKLINGCFKDVTPVPTFQKYEVNGIIKYVPESCITESDADPTKQAQVYEIQEADSSAEHTLSNVRITWDGDRMTGLQLPNGGAKIALTVANTKNDEQYTDAMNKYEYDKNQYNNTMNNINAKITIIQEQDKKLELKLKQLDTEQQALATEMDAVKKVIDKNVDATFKTFGS